MTPFVCGHATHPDWRMALSPAAAQVDAQHARQEGGGSGPLTLGFAYLYRRLRAARAGAAGGAEAALAGVA